MTQDQYRAMALAVLLEWDAKQPGENLTWRAAPLAQMALPLPCELYKPHLNELIERGLAGGDTVRYSRAELLAILSETSLRAPLNDDAFRLMSKLLGEVLPEKTVAAKLTITDPYPSDTARLQEHMSRQSKRVRKAL